MHNRITAVASLTSVYLGIEEVGILIKYKKILLVLSFNSALYFTVEKYGYFIFFILLKIWFLIVSQIMWKKKLLSIENSLSHGNFLKLIF